MKKKIMIAFLIVLMAIPTFMPIFAMTKAEMLTKLDTLAADIEDMKKEYNDVINTYPDVINSLSTESKTTIEGLTENLLAEDIEAKVNSIKTELAASTVQDADKVLGAINDLEKEAKTLIDKNQGVIEEIKTGYADLSINEAKEVISKVQNIMTDLGANRDTVATYNEMMNILNTAHADALKINTKLENVLKNNTGLYKEVVSIDLLLEIVEGVKAKDRVEVIDTLLTAIDGKAGSDALKASLKDIKNDAASVKNTLLKLENLDEQDLIMFEEHQKTAVQNKIKAVEKDYIDFAKVVLNNYAEDYLKITIDLSRTTSVDQMIEYANKAIDFVIEYKETVSDLSSADIDKLNLPKDLVKKAGLMVALGFIDTSAYNKDYVANNFNAEIESLAKFIANEFVEYLDYLDKNMKDEIRYEISSKNATLAQKSIIDINLGRFVTMDNIETLRQRVETEFLQDEADIKADIAEIMPRIYDIYNENILMTLEKVMALEFNTDNAKYDYDDLYYYIILDNFMDSSEFADELGIRQDKITISNLNDNKVKTGSALNIKLSDNVYQLYSIAVLGDLYADGLVDARDYMAIKNQVMGNANFGAVNKAAANTYRDKVLDARDYMVIKNQVMETDTISIYKGISV